MIFGGIGFSRRKKKVAAADDNGNGVSNLPDLHYIKQRAPSFRSPKIVASRAHTPQMVVHTTSKSAPINALLRYQCTRLFVDSVRGPTLTHLHTGAKRLFARKE